MGNAKTVGKAAGFASPAQGYENTTIDLNELLIKNPPATYLFRLESDDMSGLGLPKGSILIADRSKKPVYNQFALIKHEGQFLCRLMVKQNRRAVFTNGITEITPVAGETEIVGAVTSSVQIYSHDLPH